MAQTTFAARFCRVGTSRAVIIPKPVREAMRLIPGDLVVMRLAGSVLICRRLDARDVVDLDALPADAIPNPVGGNYGSERSATRPATATDNARQVPHDSEHRD